MAKVTIVISDKDDGDVDIQMEFDPPVDDETNSPAQHMGARFLASVTDGEEDEP